MDKSALPLCVGLGEILFDVIDGKPHLGGAPANFAYMCSKLGFSSCPVSSVGHDELGELAITTLDKAGLNTAYISRDSHPTGTVEVKIDEHGIPSYVFSSDCAFDHILFNGDLRNLASLCSIVCFGSLAQRHPQSRDSIMDFVKTASDAGALCVFDVNLRQNFFNEEIIRGSLCQSTVLKCNDEELPVLSRVLGAPREPDGFFSFIRDSYGCQMLVETRGADGSVIYSENGVSELEGIKVKIADTVGAGDAFTAVLTCSLVKGLPLELSHALASKAAAAVCSQHGAMVALPDEVTSALISRQAVLPRQKR
ncbi:MAG: carbohydrate kinase [Succinatimonas hippei]|nr:carbohydrate kinase [Succinatimonas hippei]